VKDSAGRPSIGISAAHRSARNAAIAISGSPSFIASRSRLCPLSPVRASSHTARARIAGERSPSRISIVGSAFSPSARSASNPRCRTLSDGFFKASIRPCAVFKSIFGGIGRLPFGSTRRIRPYAARSPARCPPTPGSHQSATYTDPSVPTHTSLGRNQRAFGSSAAFGFERRSVPGFISYPAPFATGVCA
jgi:hypothetical protein